MIGGSTSYDTNTAALAAILAEWDSTAAETYQQRINEITGAVSGGLNGSYDLNSSTVHHASSAVTLVGGTGTAFDWFFALQPRDTILHYQTGEQVKPTGRAPHGLGSWGEGRRTEVASPNRYPAGRILAVV